MSWKHVTCFNFRSAFLRKQCAKIHPDHISINWISEMKQIYLHYRYSSFSRNCIGIAQEIISSETGISHWGFSFCHFWKYQVSTQVRQKRVFYFVHSCSKCRCNCSFNHLLQTVTSNCRFDQFVLITSQTLRGLWSPFNLYSSVLCGSMTEAQRNQIKQNLG